jgi:hypothetical protein
MKEYGSAQPTRTASASATRRVSFSALGNSALEASIAGKVEGDVAPMQANPMMQRVSRRLSVRDAVLEDNLSLNRHVKSIDQTTPYHNSLSRDQRGDASVSQSQRLLEVD